MFNITSLPSEIQISILKDALIEKKLGVFFELSNQLLNTPLNAGGLDSDVIDKLFKEYNT